jgi:hypothetical protein
LPDSPAAGGMLRIMIRGAHEREICGTPHDVDTISRL